MGWSENHLDELRGIESAAKESLPGCFTCHKCGNELGVAATVEALVVRYGIPNGDGLRRWSVLCHSCETALTTRAVEMHSASNPHVLYYF